MHTDGIIAENQTMFAREIFCEATVELNRARNVTIVQLLI